VPVQRRRFPGGQEVPDVNMIDVLCVGATSYDLVFRVDHHPGPDEKAVAESFVRCGGGPASNASVTVSRMGLTAAFAGYLGWDQFGRLHLEELQAAGVNTEFVVRGDYPTPVSSVRVTPSGERSLVNYRSADSVIHPEMLDFKNIHPKVILFDGHEPELSVSLQRVAHARGIRTVLDAGSWNRGTSQLFDKVDHLVCSAKFAYEFTGESSPEPALNKLLSHNPCVVITLGREGLIWGNAGGEGRLPAYPVAVEDSTGAGDVFHGAYAGCLAMGKGFDDTLRYASAAAALSCTRLGARTGIPEGAEVRRFLDEYRAKADANPDGFGMLQQG
jgi:sulfofructose kinase